MTLSAGWPNVNQNKVNLSPNPRSHDLRRRKESVLNRKIALFCLIVLFSLLPLAGVAAAQTSSQPQPKGWVAAQVQFEKNCSKCHGSGDPRTHAASRGELMKLSPEAIYASMTTGSMSVQSKGLTDDQKRLIAQHLGGRPFGVAAAGDANAMSNRCSANPPLSDPSSGACLEWLEQ